METGYQKSEERKRIWLPWNRATYSTSEKEVNKSQGGVGFLVNRVLRDNVVEICSISTRIGYLILKLTKRYSLQVIQVYALTSKSSDGEVGTLYEDVSKAYT